MLNKIPTAIGTIAAAGCLLAPLSMASAQTSASPAAPGGAVSAPRSPQNDAVNRDGNRNEKTQTPGSNSFTQAQAKEHIEKAGYSAVTDLTKTTDGLWVGKATKGGKTVDVSLDFKGAVAAK